MIGHTAFHLLLWGLSHAMKTDSRLLVKALDSVASLFDKEALNKTINALARSAAGGVYRRVSHAPHCDLGPDSGEIVTPLQRSIRRY
ncbi:hypothetical protein FOZ61_004488, partial [Perkinsus olseni]